MILLKKFVIEFVKNEKKDTRNIFTTGNIFNFCIFHE